MTTVRVHPCFTVPYYCFYLEGLGRVFGHSSLRFEHAGGPEATEFDDGFACEIASGTQSFPRIRRLYISANDFARYDTLALAWSDRYGIVNHDPQSPKDGNSQKVVPIGPSFGVRDWAGSVGGSLSQLVRLAVAHRANPRKGAKALRNTSKLLTQRVPERRYVPGESRDNYVYYVSWPWLKHPEVNPPRARFMRACKAVDACEFEGGFSPRRRLSRGRAPAVPGTEDVTAEKLYPFDEWMTKTKRSAVVFNCPAVHSCLGWKLGEFLAMGKAMVSLPLTRSMPRPLEHGVHVHYVEDDIEQMKEGVRLLLRDRSYRSRLELEARRYYLEFLSPERVISRLLF